MQQQNEKKFFVLEIIASELIALNCLYSEENTSYRQAVCYETVLRFCISLTVTFYKSIAFTVIKKYGKGAAMHISTMFWRIYHVAFRKIP